MTKQIQNFPIWELKNKFGKEKFILFDVHYANTDLEEIAKCDNFLCNKDSTNSDILIIGLYSEKLELGGSRYLCFEHNETIMKYIKYLQNEFLIVE